MKLLAFLEKQKTTWVLIFISLAFTLLRFPSLFEPYWYGDEGIYEVIGHALRNGRLLYSGIWDNKPPILYYIYALVDGDQFGAKLLSILAGVGAIITFYFVSKKLIDSVIARYSATALFAILFGLPLIEGNIANAENFMLFPILLSILGVLSFTHKHLVTKQLGKLFLPGFLIGLAFMTKIVGLFDFAACCVFILLYTWEDLTIHYLYKYLQTIFFFVLGFLTPFVWFLVFFTIRGNIKAFIQSAFASNVGYVGYGNTFIIPQGFLIFKLVLLATFLFLVWKKRTILSVNRLFIFIWLAFSVFNALFSGRPYTHYLLVLLPSVCLLAGLMISDKKHWKLDGLVLGITLLIVFRGFSLYSKPLAYYTNFINFITAKQSVSNYQGFFDKAVLRDEDIIQIITLNKNPDSTLFLWGNDGQIYKRLNILPQSRYIVAYHATSNAQTLLEVQKIFAKHPTSFVVLLPGQSPLPISLVGYKLLIGIDGAFIYEKAF